MNEFPSVKGFGGIQSDCRAWDVSCNVVAVRRV
jgi:hypothetical protein